MKGIGATLENRVPGLFPIFTCERCLLALSRYLRSDPAKQAKSSVHKFGLQEISEIFMKNVRALDVHPPSGH